MTLLKSEIRALSQNIDPYYPKPSRARATLLMLVNVILQCPRKQFLGLIHSKYKQFYKIQPLAWYKRYYQALPDRN